MTAVIVAMLGIVVVCVVLGFILVFRYDTTSRDAAIIFTVLLAAIAALYLITLWFNQAPEVMSDIQLLFGTTP